jgi:hypothetical protein
MIIATLQNVLSATARRHVERGDQSIPGPGIKIIMITLTIVMVMILISSSGSINDSSISSSLTYSCSLFKPSTFSLCKVF